MAWMRETRIMTFMRMELEACLDEVEWMIRCHNCAAFNCPQKEYPPRPLPIPPDYVDNLQSRLVKVKNGTLAPDDYQDVLSSSSTSSARNLARSAA